MNRKLPPNLYQRQYRTRGGYKRTLYHAQFTDWTHKRRFFPLGDDYAQALDRYHELMRQNRRKHDFDTVIVAPSLALFTWIDKILAIREGRPVTERHGYSIKHLKRLFPENPLLTDLTNGRMLLYRTKRRTEGAAIATINREVDVLKIALLQAKADGAIEKVPEIPREKENNERVRTASDIEYKRVLRALKPDDRDFAEMIREMGFRPKDIHAITPADIDFPNQAIRMDRIRSKFGHKRPLPLSARAWAILSRRSKGLDKHALLFPFSRHRIRTAFDRAAKGVGITDLWLYDLKATFCTEKLRDRWPREVIMEFTGHKTESAFRRYVRPTAEDLRAYIRPQKGRTAITLQAKRSRRLRTSI